MINLITRRRSGHAGLGTMAWNTVETRATAILPPPTGGEYQFSQLDTDLRDMLALCVAVSYFTFIL